MEIQDLEKGAQSNHRHLLLFLYLHIGSEDGERGQGKFIQKNLLLWVFESYNQTNKFHWDKQGRVIKIESKRKDMEDSEDVTYYFQYEMY